MSLASPSVAKITGPLNRVLLLSRVGVVVLGSDVATWPAVIGAVWPASAVAAVTSSTFILPVFGPPVGSIVGISRDSSSSAGANLSGDALQGGGVAMGVAEAETDNFG